MLPRTLDELEIIKKECHSMVTKRAAMSAGTSAIPVPGVDIAADIAILVELIPAINRKFGLSSEQINEYSPTTKNIIYLLIKQAGLTMIGAEVTKEVVTQIVKKIAGRTAAKQFTKFIPGVGQIVNAVIGFGAMKYVGSLHVNDCYEVCKRLLLSTPAMVGDTAEKSLGH